MENKTTETLHFNASLPIQIRFGDIDALGHINNNIYLSYFDLGKAEYFEKLRGSAVSWTEGAIVIAHLEMDFVEPTFYTERIVVESKVIKVGDKSGEFLQQLRSEKTGAIKCVCKSVFVYIDSNSQKPASVPYVWREAIEKFENVKF